MFLKGFFSSVYNGSLIQNFYRQRRSDVDSVGDKQVLMKNLSPISSDKHNFRYFAQTQISFLVSEIEIFVFTVIYFIEFLLNFSFHIHLKKKVLRPSRLQLYKRGTQISLPPNIAHKESARTFRTSRNNTKLCIKIVEKFLLSFI